MGENLDERGSESDHGTRGVAGVGGSAGCAEEGQDETTDHSATVQPTRAQRGDIENRARGVQGIRPQDAFKRCDEDLAEVRMAGHKAVVFGIQEEQHDAPYRSGSCDQAENEADDPRPTSTPLGPLSQSRECRLPFFSCHLRHPGSGATRSTAGRTLRPLSISESTVAAHAGREDRNPFACLVTMWAGVPLACLSGSERMAVTKPAHNTMTT